MLTDRDDYMNYLKAFAASYAGRSFKCLQSNTTVILGDKIKPGQQIQVGNGFIITGVGELAGFSGSIVEIK